MRFSTNCDLQVQRLHWALSVKDKISELEEVRGGAEAKVWSLPQISLLYKPVLSLPISTPTCSALSQCWTESKVQQDIGFQGNDPVTDLRGIGMLGLECLQYPLCSNQLLWPPVLMFPWPYPLQLFLCQPSRQSSWSALSLTPSYMP